MEEIKKLKKLLKRQIACLVLALTPVGAVYFAAGLFPWIWILLLFIGMGLLLLEKSLITLFKNKLMKYPGARNKSSIQKENWARIFWIANFLFLLGVWCFWELEIWILFLFVASYLFFQYWAYKVLFKEEEKNR